MARPVKPLYEPGYTKNPAVACCFCARQRTCGLAMTFPGDDRLTPPNNNSSYLAYEQAAIALRDSHAAALRLRKHR